MRIGLAAIEYAEAAIGMCRGGNNDVLARHDFFASMIQSHPKLLDDQHDTHISFHALHSRQVSITVVAMTEYKGP